MHERPRPILTISVHCLLHYSYTNGSCSRALSADGLMARPTTMQYSRNLKQQAKPQCHYDIVANDLADRLVSAFTIADSRSCPDQSKPAVP